MTNNKVPGLIDHELKSDNGDPFDKCKLNRKESAEVLTQLISNYREGFVLALNSEWGTGKTTFLNMWQEYLEIRDFETVHFNAWKTDYSADPFIALISQLDMFNQSKARNAYQSFLKKGSKLITKVGPGLLKGIVKHYIGDEALSELVDASAGIAADSLESQIDEQLKTEKSVDEFREALSELVKEVSTDGKPLVFIIDELDRCRPNYAVAVLEYIKHFFAVKGIVFVLGIDKEQLGHAVCGVYGSDEIDADEYLRRFIDLEFSLPEPEMHQYFEFLFEYYGFKQYCNSSIIYQYANSLFRNKSIHLRQAEKFFFHLKIILTMSSSIDNESFGLYVYLLYLKQFDSEKYKKIFNQKASLDEIAQDFESQIKIQESAVNQKLMIRIEAILIHIYTEYYNQDKHNTSRLSAFDFDNESLKFKTTLTESLKNKLESEVSYATTVGHEELKTIFNKLEINEHFYTMG